MKTFVITLLATAWLAPGISVAQKNTSTKQQQRTDTRMQENQRNATPHTVVNNPQDTTSGTPLNSQREIDLKNGGADRTGGQTAK